MCAADICRSYSFIPRQMDRIYINITQHRLHPLNWRERIKDIGQIFLPRATDCKSDVCLSYLNQDAKPQFPHLCNEDTVVWDTPNC